MSHSQLSFYKGKYCLTIEGGAMNKIAPQKSVLPTQSAPISTEKHHWIVHDLEHTDHADYARLEKPDGEFVHVLLELLPQGLQQGDVLNIQFDHSGFQATRITSKS